MRDSVHTKLKANGDLDGGTEVYLAHARGADGAGLTRNIDCPACKAKYEEVQETLGESKASEFWVYGLGLTDSQYDSLLLTARKDVV